MPYCIGLTGGIGSGKSSAADCFAALGAGIIDTDAISRELTAAGGAAMPSIRDQFGAEYVGADGALDRVRMRIRVFAEALARRQLEAILHPLIGRESRRRLAAARAPYVLLVVPLLLETGAYRELIRRVLVVDCPEALQIERTIRRSRITESEVRAIMAAQLPRAERLARADDVIHNDGDTAALQARVAELHRQYLALAQAP